MMTLGELGLEQKLSKPKSKEDDSDAPQLLFSPTLKYVGNPELSPPVRFKDKKTGRAYQGQVAFQIEVHPGSYKIGPPSCSLLQPDPHFKDDETEWLTKERGNTVITALLIQMLPVPSC
jgi:neuralized-like protein 4